jgi:hypothetical protein
MVLFIYFTLLQAYTTELELKVALLGEENAKLRKQQERVSTVEEECFFFFNIYIYTHIYFYFPDMER